MTEPEPINELSYADQLRLKNFLRDAEAIITTERGFTANTHRKLESLAQHQQLPERLLQQAIAQLEDSGSAVAQRNRYEQAFVSFLEGQLAKLDGDVLSLKAEEKALELATTKYQIAPARAEKLITECLRTASIVRIARSDVEDYVEQSIRELVGTKRSVDAELEASIRTRGEQLGVSPASIDQAILKVLRQNRRQRFSVWRMWLTSVVGVTLVLAGLASVMWFLFLPTRKPDPIEPQAEVETTIPFDVNLNPVAESWLSEESVALLEQLQWDAKQKRQLILDFKQPLLNPDPAVRIEAYRKLSELILDRPFYQSSALPSLLGNLFCEEPNAEAALAMTETILNAVRLPDAGSQLQLKWFEQQYHANEVLGELAAFSYANQMLEPLIQTRKKELTQRLQLLSGVSAQGLLASQYLQQSEPLIATDQWNQLIQQSWSQPRVVSSLVQPLQELTRSRLSLKSREQLRSRLLQTLMEIEPAQCLNLKTPLKETIMAADEFEVRDWISLVVSLNQTDLQRVAGPLLLERVGVSPDSNRLEDVVATLRSEVVRQRTVELQSLIQRDEQLQQVTNEFLETLTRSGHDNITPDQIAQLARLVNVHIALFELASQHHTDEDQWLVAVDQLLAAPKVRLRDLVSVTGTVTTEPAALTATPADNNRKNLALRRLSDISLDQSSSRVRALDDLAKIADRIQDLSYSDAKILADYFLRTSNNAESLMIQRRIGSLNHWPMLGLALLDRINELSGEGKEVISMDRALTIARLYFNREFEMESANGDWRQILTEQMLLAIESELQLSIPTSPDSSQQDWIRLEYFLTDCYRQRNDWQQGRLSDESVVLFASPAEASLGLVKWQLAQVSGHDSRRAPIERATALIQQDFFNSLEQTILANRLLVDLMSESLEMGQTESLSGFPKGADFQSAIIASAAIENLVNTLQKKFPSKLLGDRLFEVELDLLRVFSQRRSTAMQRRLRGLMSL